MSNASSNTPAPASGPATSTPTPAPLPKAAWGALAAILVTVLTFILANAAGAILMNVVPQFFGWGTERISEWLDQSVAAQFFYILIVEACTLAFLWWFVRRRKGTLTMLGLGRRPRWNDLGLGIAGFFVYMAVFIIGIMALQAVLPINVDQEQELGFGTYGHGTVALMMIFTSLVILPPITEEILFRGFLFSGVRRSLGVVVSVLITSLIFGAFHLLGGKSGESLLWIAGIDTFILSLMLCYLRVKTNALWAPMIVHAAKNSLAFVSLFIFHAG